jgi:hypothetical protein
MNEVGNQIFPPIKYNFISPNLNACDLCAQQIQL